MGTYSAVLHSNSVALNMPDGPTERGSIGDFQGQLQAAERWCWAAAAASVHATYLKLAVQSGKQSPSDPVTQCSIVDSNLPGPGDACSKASGIRCDAVTEPGTYAACINEEKNREGFLDLALKNLGLLEKTIVLGSGRSYAFDCETAGEIERLTVSDTLDFDEIKTLIDRNRLVCLRIVRGDIRHFVVIFGYEAYPDNDLLIWNPSNGAEVVDFDGFWREFGPFTHKIITRPPT